MKQKKPNSLELFRDFTQALRTETSSGALSFRDVLEFSLLLYHLHESSSLLYRQSFGGEENTVRNRLRYEVKSNLIEIGCSDVSVDPHKKIKGE